MEPRVEIADWENCFKLRRRTLIGTFPPSRTALALLPCSVPPDVRSVSDFPTSLPDSEQPLLWFARFESCVFAIHRFARS